jgi:hypothetical protein
MSTVSIADVFSAPVSHPTNQSAPSQPAVSFSRLHSYFSLLQQQRMPIKRLLNPAEALLDSEFQEIGMNKIKVSRTIPFIIIHHWWTAGYFRCWLGHRNAR